MNDNFFISGGDLCRNDRTMRTVRPYYSKHFREIETGAQLRASLRAGKSTDVGGYRLAFLASDGESMCFDCVRDNLRLVTQAIRDKDNSGWRVVGIVGEHETDEACQCANCNKEIWSGPDSEPCPNAAYLEYCEARGLAAATAKDKEFWQRLAGSVRKASTL